MTLYLNDGDSVVQILACGQDPHRLCDDISTHVAADRAKHAAVYEARVSIDQTRLMAPNAAVPQSPEHTPTKSPTKLPSYYLGQTNLTLTLLHMDTTFRFNSVSASSCSPGLAWPTIHRSFASSPFVDDDIILRAQYHHPNTSFGRHISPGSLLLHVEISAISHPDAVLFQLAKSFRAMRSFWTRQLLFSQDPARLRKPSEGVLSVLIQEFGSQHTAETITAHLDDVSLRHILDEYGAEISVRLFSLVGSSSHRLKIPMEPSDLPIQNRLYENRAPSGNAKEELYFGLRPESYVHI